MLDYEFINRYFFYQLEPSDGLLKLLQVIFGNPDRTRLLYPVLLLDRRLALAAKGLPVDPG